jgi:hypothetical protein
MSRNVESSFFCKRCRADDAKRCRCPLPFVPTNHEWDADAIYNLWPDAEQAPAAAATGGGAGMGRSQLPARSQA